MNLHSLLEARSLSGRPVSVALIGAGKFGTMFLAQARRTRGIHVAALCDLAPARAREKLAAIGWPAQQYAARSIPEALQRGTTFVGDDAAQAIAAGAIELVIDATGDPAAGVRHALRCCTEGKHIVMVNVEADALAGPWLAAQAKRAGVVYSLAYGDQPALICEMVDWARTAGFEVIAAGKGTKYLPSYHESTPDTIWSHYGFSPEAVAKGDFNARMFNSFLDGTKSAIEMTAVANATGLTPAPGGLAFPPCGVEDLASVLRPLAAGGVLDHPGQVEVISSLRRDGSPIERDLRWGVFVTLAAASAYVRRCFAQYGLITDASGEYCAVYKSHHLIGLELGISVASVALRREATGYPTGFRADAVATAKRSLAPGEMLDGEGGYTTYARLMPAAASLALGALPIGLAGGVRVRTPIAAHDTIRWADVESPCSEAADARRAMERAFSASPAALH